MFKTRPIEMGVAICLIFSKDTECKYINMLDCNIKITHNRIKYTYYTKYFFVGVALISGS